MTPVKYASHFTGQAEIQMTETVLCGIRFRDCNFVCLFPSLEHSSFEFVSACPGAMYQGLIKDDYQMPFRPLLSTITLIGQPALVRRDVDIQLFSLLMNSSLSITAS